MKQDPIGDIPLLFAIIAVVSVLTIGLTHESKLNSPFPICLKIEFLK